MATLFANIILQSLISFINEKDKEISSLIINKIKKKDNISLDLFQDINIFENSYLYKKSLEKEWNSIDKQIYKELAEKEEREEKRISALVNATDNLNELSNELAKEENMEDLNTIQEVLAEEEYKKEQQRQVKILLDKFYKQNHPELTLPEFVESTSFTNFKPTALMHDFILKEQTEYDLYADSHLSFISDFFPVNNIDVSTLIKEVRKAIKINEENSAINIYKEWLKYLKDNNANYYQYDWRNFNDSGEYIGNNTDKEKLDEYILSENKIIMYDEVKDKEKAEEQFQEHVKKILSDGSYKPNFQLSAESVIEIKNRKELYANK